MNSPVFFLNWYNLCIFIDIKVQKSTKSHNCLMIFNIENDVLKKSEWQFICLTPKSIFSCNFWFKNGGLKLGVDLEWFPGPQEVV